MAEEKQHNQPVVLETERLFIKPIALADAPFILELLNAPSWIKFIGDRNVHTVSEAEEYIRVRMLPQLEKLGYGNNLVIRKEDNVPMGACGLYERPGLPIVDVGFAFLPAFEKKGYGFEAASAVLQSARDNFGLRKVCAITLDENLASKNLLKKLGLTYIKDILMEGDSHPMMYYEMVL
ncbi:MAG: GNAT family N-acetyltransferase [Ferruginibacter sp.]